MPSHSIATWKPTPNAAVRQASDLERATRLSQWRPRTVAVVPLEAAAPTSVVAALITLAADRTLDDNIIGVDTSADRPLAHLLGARTGGNLSALGASRRVTHERRTIERFVDMNTATGVAVISPSMAHPHVGPEHMSTALAHLSRRFRGYVIDIPSVVAESHMTAALQAADYVVAATCTSRIPDWLFTTPNPLQRFINSSRFSIVHAYGQIPEAAIVRFNMPVPTFGLGIENYPDGRWNLPITGRGMNLREGTLHLTDVAVRICRFLFGTNAKTN